MQYSDKESNIINNRTAEIFAVVIIFFIMFIIRFIFLSADPPVNTHAHFFTDEGWKTRNARNYVLFGKWIMDEHNNVLNSPLNHIASYLSFTLFGTGLKQARLVSAFTGSLTLILLYMLVKREWNRKGAVLSSCLAGFSFFFATYNRLAFQETMIILFIVLTLFLWQKGEDNKWFYLLSGVSCSLAYLTKASGIVVAPLIIVLFLYQNYYMRTSEPSKKKTAILYFVFGILPLFLLWHFFSGYLFGIPTQTNPMKYSGSLAFIDLFKYIAIFPTSPIFGQIPILTILSLIYVLHVICLLKNEHHSFLQSLSSFEFLCLIWFLWSCIFIAIMHFQPDRRYLTLIPPMSILSAKVLLEIRSISPKALFEGYNKTKGSWYFQWSLYLLLLIPTYFLLAHGMVTAAKIINLIGAFSVQANLAETSLIAFIVVILLSIYFMVKRPQRFYHNKLKKIIIHFAFIFFFSCITGTHLIVQVSKQFGITTGVEKGLYFGSAILITSFLIIFVVLAIYVLKGTKTEDLKFMFPGKLAVAIIIIFFMTNGYYYLSWAKNRSYTIVTSSKKLRKYVNTDSTIIGGVADTLAFETDAYALQSGFGNTEKPIERFKPDFAIIKRFRDGNWLPMPEYLAGTKLKMLERFMICPTGNKSEYRFIVDLFEIEKKNLQKDTP